MIWDYFSVLHSIPCPKYSPVIQNANHIPCLQIMSFASIKLLFLDNCNAKKQEDRLHIKVCVFHFFTAQMKTHTFVCGRFS
jgi:hypothetical protein